MNELETWMDFEGEVDPNKIYDIHTTLGKVYQNCNVIFTNNMFCFGVGSDMYMPFQYVDQIKEHSEEEKESE